MRLKRYAMPKFWKIPRKKYFWVTRPLPGPHPIERSIPLQIILRDILGLAETSTEVKNALKGGSVLVDKKPRLEPAFPVGLMDIIQIPDMKKTWRVDVGKGGLVLEKIKPGFDNLKLCQITGKTTIKKGLIQLNLHDGRNILVKDAKTYKCHDSVLIQLPDQKILKHYKFEPDAPAFIIAGTNIGQRGKIKKIRKRKTMLEQSSVIIRTATQDIQTRSNCIMVGEVEAKPPKLSAKKTKKKVSK